MEKLMIGVATLRQRLEYVGTTLPNSLFEATFHAVRLGAVEARRGGVQYIQALQELTTCRPELLNWPALLVTYEEGREQLGMIFLERDFRALFLFRTSPAINASLFSSQDYRDCRPSSFTSESRYVNATDKDQAVQEVLSKISPNLGTIMQREVSG
jgi:hypothetical protein